MVARGAIGAAGRQRWAAWVRAERPLRAGAGRRALALLALVALACGETEIPERGESIEASTLADGVAGSSASTAAADNTAASGDTAASSGAECPAPGAGNCAPEQSPLWSRDPATGVCCPYDRACQTPEGWSAFATQEECESSCRCRDVTPDDLSMVETLGSAALATERTTLTCWCGDHDCPESLAETVSNVCAGDSSSFSLVVGCGMVAVRYSNLSGSDRVFDATSGALLGVADYADTITGPCRVINTFAGVEFDCPSAVECPLCDGTEPRLDGCE